jgi:serine O-acetyltransferase
MGCCALEAPLAVQSDSETVAVQAGKSQWRALATDWARCRTYGDKPWSSAGFWAVAIYRLQRMGKTTKRPWIWLPARVALALFRRPFALITKIDISSSADIGPGLLVPHAGTIFVHGDTRMGAGCTIFHGCTIGGGPAGTGGANIGDNVFLSCNSTILGNVTIGDGVLVAANSLVLMDIPAGRTAIGVPAKVLPGTVRTGLDVLSQQRVH